jgi:hypothetical protein
MVLVISVAASESVRAIARRSVPTIVNTLNSQADTLYCLTHDIGLSSDSHKPIDVFVDGD